MAKKSPQTIRPAVRKPAARTRRTEFASGSRRSSRATNRTPGTATPKLLSGGNPQIPKGYGPAPVQAYLEAMPGWKRDVGRQLDALIERAVPGVCKAVKWNTPLYGLEGQGWFLGFHCFDRYIKVTFFRGQSLRPVPPVESKSQDTRYVHLFEAEPLDVAQLSDWVQQAARLPGERM